MIFFQLSVTPSLMGENREAEKGTESSEWKERNCFRALHSNCRLSSFRAKFVNALISSATALLWVGERSSCLSALHKASTFLSKYALSCSLSCSLEQTSSLVCFPSFLKKSKEGYRFSLLLVMSVRASRTPRISISTTFSSRSSCLVPWLSPRFFAFFLPSDISLLLCA